MCYFKCCYRFPLVLQESHELLQEIVWGQSKAKKRWKRGKEGSLKVDYDDWKVSHPLANIITSWEACLAPLGFAHSVGIKNPKTGLMVILMNIWLMEDERWSWSYWWSIPRMSYLYLQAHYLFMEEKWTNSC